MLENQAAGVFVHLHIVFLCRYGGLRYLSLHLLEIIYIIFDIGYVIIIQMLLEIIEGSAEDDNVWICLIILFVTP